jgi:hypothetical protein
MNTNPYAPLVAHAEDVHGGHAKPPLWNPNTAALWSLALSPAFGAWIHMKNWQALGEPEKASESRNWVIATLLFSLLMSVATTFAQETQPIDFAADVINLVLMLCWYFGCARPQAENVKQRFGKSYPRKGWRQPLLIALVLWVAACVLVAVLIEVQAAGAPSLAWQRLVAVRLASRGNGRRRRVAETGRASQ